MSASPSQFRVAAVQAAPVFLDLDGTIDKTIDLMAQAAGKGVQLIAFPGNLGARLPVVDLARFAGLGHAVRAALPRQFAHRRLAGGRPHPRGRPQAPHLGRRWATAKRPRGSLYIAQALIDDQGRTPLQTRRKLKPTHVERTVFGEGDGSDLA